MPPGGTHKHVVTYAINKWVPCDKVLKSPIFTGNGVLGGLTKVTMAVLRGYPSKLSAGGVVDEASSVVYTYV